MGYDNEYTSVLEDLASGRMTGIEDLITKKIQLGKVVQDGLQPLLTNRNGEGERKNASQQYDHS